MMALKLQMSAAKTNLNPKEKIDSFKIKSYEFEVILSPEEDTLWIKAYIKISCLQNKLNSICFNLNPQFRIISVKCDNVGRLDYSFIKKLLTAYFPYYLNIGNDATIIIEYSACLKSLCSMLKKSDIWMRYDSLWYPTTEQVQFSTFKCTVKLPIEFEVITHGELVNLKIKKRSKIYLWVERKPIARFCLIVGRYQKKDKILDNLTLSIYYYSYPSDNLVDNYFFKAERIIDFFSRMQCEYPLRILKIVEITDEDQRSYSDSSIILLNTTNFNEPSEEKLGHEIAHQWWGNLMIFCGEYGNILTESIAEFFSLLYLESLTKIKYADNFIKELNLKRLNKSNIATNIDLLIARYRQKIKYISILNNLRHSLGEIDFKRYLGELTKRYGFKIVDVDDFISEISKYVS